MKALTTAPIDTHYIIDDPLVRPLRLPTSLEVTRDLQLAIERFVSLERVTCNYRLLYHNVELAIFQIMDAIRTCERVGMEPSEIKSYLLPV